MVESHVWVYGNLSALTLVPHDEAFNLKKLSDQLIYLHLKDSELRLVSLGTS